MYILGYLIGLLLGLVFFGGLYLSVRKMADLKHPGAFMMLGTILRMAVLLAGFYLLRTQGAAVMLLALLGVVTVRLVMVRWQKRVLAEEQRGEVDHEH